jgi:hypothetical protein
MDFLNRLDFDNDASLHSAVEAVTGINCGSFVSQRKDKLPLNKQAALNELIGNAFFVRTFQHSRTEGAVHVYRGTDDFARHRILFPPLWSSVISVVEKGSGVFP